MEKGWYIAAHLNLYSVNTFFSLLAFTVLSQTDKQKKKPDLVKDQYFVSNYFLFSWCSS